MALLSMLATSLASWQQALRWPQAEQRVQRLAKRVAGRVQHVAGPLLVALGYLLILGIARVHFTKFLPSSTPHVALSVFLAVEVLLQYSLAIWRNPGYVELEHVADFLAAEEQQPQEAQLERIDAQMTDKTAFCRRCVRVKPRRAHHCRTCGRCVFEMDHHCPWLNNCVGYYNYRHFWLLLLYLWLSCMYVALLSAGLFLSTFTTSSGEQDAATGDGRLDRFVVLFSFMTTSAVGVVLCGYWSWHFYLVLTQQTTVEFMQRPGERLPLVITAASVRHALTRLLGRQDVLWPLAFVLPLQTLSPPKYAHRRSPSQHNGLV